MDAQSPNPMPEHRPGPHAEVSGLVETLDQQPVLVGQSTPLTEEQEHYNPILSRVTGWSPQIKSEEQAYHLNQPVQPDYDSIPPTLIQALIQAVRTEIQSGFQAVQIEVQSGVDRIISCFKGIIFGLPAQPSASSTVADLTDQLRAEKKNSKDLMSQYSRLVQISNNQGNDLCKANARLEDALRERDQLRQLLDGGSLANPNKSTDNSIRAKWNEIAYNIRCLAHLLDHDPSPQLRDLVTMRLRFISTDYRRLLKDQDYRVLLMMGYLWVIVQDEVFHAEDPLWGGPDMKSFKNTRYCMISRMGKEGSLSDNETLIAHAARWLSQGSVMMRKLWEKDDAAIKRLMFKETNLLRPFFPAQQSLMDRSDKKVSDLLQVILSSAIELDKMMMCSKAIFQIHWRDQSQNPAVLERWNPDAMDSKAHENDLTTKSRVKFSISPIVYKTGTADGQKYDSQMVLAKASVVCN